MEEEKPLLISLTKLLASLPANNYGWKERHYQAIDGHLCPSLYEMCREF